MTDVVCMFLMLPEDRRIEGSISSIKPNHRPTQRLAKLVESPTDPPDPPAINWCICR
jgi:hypothetical protein